MIPIDEMLYDLRAVLEDFSERLDDTTFEAVQRELMRIEFTCEGMIVEEENV